jgi:hypothetical protein
MADALRFTQAVVPPDDRIFFGMFNGSSIIAPTRIPGNGTELELALCEFDVPSH